MITHNRDQNIAGKFKFSSGREVFGYISIDGEASKVSLFDDKEFKTNSPDYKYITGELYDGRVVSLFECIYQSGQGFWQNHRSSMKYSATYFPHYITIGSAYVPESAPCISSVSFEMEDAPVIFHDYDAFSTVFDEGSVIQYLSENNTKQRQIKLGDHPIIAYYTGVIDIAVVKTVLGEVKAHHRPSFGNGGPRGVAIENEVTVTLKTTELKTFQECIKQLSTLLRFFELVLGREQPLRNLEIELNEQREESPTVKIYRSFSCSSRYDIDFKNSVPPHPGDVLVSIIKGDSEQYSVVLKNYLALDNERHEGRIRLQSLLKNSLSYTIDRIIAAANLFDILPDSIFPRQLELTPELIDAKKKSRELFKTLPESIERNSMLSAIGRIGNLSLKQKIQHRVTSTKLDKHFPQLLRVLYEAVDCRNHYVHGTNTHTDYTDSNDLVVFLTDALEFTYAASDLIDSGWDILSWKKLLPVQSHPFAYFASTYAQRLKEFKKSTGMKKEE